MRHDVDVVRELDRIDRVDDLHTAKQWAKLYIRENDRLRRKLAETIEKLAKVSAPDAAKQLSVELALLNEQLGALQQRQFGESSERRSGTSSKPEKKAPSGHGPRPQPKLPVERTLLEIPEELRTCAACGGPLEEMKGQVEETEQITARAREYIVQLLAAQKYRCRCGIGVRTAAKPVSHIKGGRYSMDFAVDVAVDKYINHLPLDRQRRMMGRAGLEIDTQTLWDQIEALARHLEPSYQALRSYILDADVVGADETWWRLMDGSGSKRWWAWSLTVPGAVWHGIAPSRSAATARGFIGDFEGTLMVDGYKAYETLAADHGRIRLAHCWAHVRRKYFEAERNYPQCGEALDLLGELFALDHETEDPSLLEGERRAHAERARLETRNARGRPLLEKLRAWAAVQRGLPKSSLRESVEYMLHCWQGLTVFLEDPYVPLDNNRTERALRGLVIGRKNHYGSRSARGTEVAAIFYSLLESAILNDLEPRGFIHYAASRQIIEGLPTLPSDRPR